MRKIILLLILLVSFNISAQQERKTKKLFVRVFDLNGKKIGKGYFYSANDSVLILNKNKIREELYLKEIGKIKTKRSGGHNILIGAGSGIVVGVIVGSANQPTEDSGGNFTWAGSSSGDELLVGMTLGAVSGTLVGALSNLFKNPKTFSIEANQEKWKVCVQAINQHTMIKN